MAELVFGSLTKGPSESNRIAYKLKLESAAASLAIAIKRLFPDGLSLPNVWLARRQAG
jgi:hypothetical protein